MSSCSSQPGLRGSHETSPNTISFAKRSRHNGSIPPTKKPADPQSRQFPATVVMPSRPSCTTVSSKSKAFGPSTDDNGSKWGRIRKSEKLDLENTTAKLCTRNWRDAFGCEWGVYIDKKKNRVRVRRSHRVKLLITAA